MESQSQKIVGIMSGTSMDGLDLALCEFKTQNGQISFKLLASETFAYNDDWKQLLQNVFNASADTYFKLHSAYGAFIGEQVSEFLTKNKQSANAIASHGHTIFHQPQFGYTSQIGCGATIAAKTGINTVCDFRSLDVALCGQGAPLVPIGDRDLFHQAAACLNIGGIANISFTSDNKTSAFDICIANMALNYLTETVEKAFDDGGKMAASGNCNNTLLQSLLKLNTNQQSLGREFFENHFLPILNNSTISLNDKLATCVEYTAIKICETLNQYQLNSVLITGGGAYNTFLIERLKHYYKGTIEIPSDEIIQFKEAIIFAYLGYLRLNEKTNTLNSVTNASRNSIGGAVYLGRK
jgi:anhydro-N-acetylmuramic acid kinase